MIFFLSDSILGDILQFYLIFILLFLIVRFVTKSKIALALLVPFAIILAIYELTKFLGLQEATTVFYYAKIIVISLSVIILAPDVKTYLLEGWSKNDLSNFINTSIDTKVSITDAVMELSKNKTGALITIEKHQLLDQYSEKAIVMNSDISKELLINIFSPLTPLHDGAVIIKGNKIRCAGAYYVLSQRDNLDKTVGSRHRAALGIAEVTDSVTIVVSEETGSISMAYSGIFMKMNSREQLLEYISVAMEKED